ncbi:MAG: DNA-formamidopyrimidine glycosylase [Firmicutes bacterium]|nr:DNA-formamidopyrimidine glycosylase [Bacillota bacterium]
MPEKPEVITVANKLKSKNLNRKIIDVVVKNSSTIDFPTVSEFTTRIKGQQINDITTRGKWIVIELDKDFLLIHLRMTGKFFYRKKEDEISSHEHVIFTLDNNEELRFHDTRKFGKMKLIPKEKIDEMPPFTELGLEVWDEKLTANYLLEKLKRKSLPIKIALLDQTIITGIGNIYADEILFLTKLNPTTPSNQVKEKELNQLISNSIKVLDKAIEEGGTTIRDYTSEEGVTGLFQNHLNVHQQEGKACLICSTTIVKTRIGGRGTYYCPTCQKDTK